QNLLNFLTGSLGASAVSLTTAGGELGISLSFDQNAAPQTYTVGLGLGSALSNLVPLNGSGQVSFQAHAGVHLAFGIGTGAGALSDRVFIDIDHTDVSVSAVADAGYKIDQGSAPASLNFSVGIGPVSYNVTNARFLLRPSFDAHLLPGSGTPGRL